jgi:formylglycine-generating enzyme required for sulfatase activity
VLQLSGNVSEWVRPAVAEAPPKPRQIVRGGSWSGLAIDLHPAKLMFLNADETEAANVGFRCARSVGREGEEK